MTAVVIPAAGEGKRTGLKENKMFFPLNGEPIIKRTVRAFLSHPLIDAVCVVCSKKDEERMKSILGNSVLYALGGQTRADSVYNGVKKVENSDKVLIHDGARPFVDRDTVTRVINAVSYGCCAVAGVKVYDTLKKINGDGLVEKTVDRDKYFRAQTPQGFMTAELLEAYEKATCEYTDDVQLYENIGKKVIAVDGSENNKKITTAEDLKSEPVFLTGIGYDVHKLAENRKLIIGGVEIPYEKGLLGHSDADVLLHAVCDALLGASGEGDIGKHFPDTDERYKGIDSTLLLKEVCGFIEEKGYKTVNVSAVVVAQKPKLAPFIEEMNDNIARILGLDRKRVNVAATTTEKLGFEGREEGISATATVMLAYYGK